MRLSRSTTWSSLLPHQTQPMLRFDSAHGETSHQRVYIFTNNCAFGKSTFAVNQFRTRQRSTETQMPARISHLELVKQLTALMATVFRCHMNGEKPQHFCLGYTGPSTTLAVVAFPPSNRLQRPLHD